MFFLCLALLGCQDIKPIEKPVDLIDQNTMQEILFDIALVNAARGFNVQQLVQNKIKPEKYIFEKYNIDSTRYTQSTNYYSSHIEKYKKMHLAVKERIEVLHAFNDSAERVEKKRKDSIKKIETAAAKKRLDSIKEARKDSVVDPRALKSAPKALKQKLNDEQR